MNHPPQVSSIEDYLPPQNMEAEQAVLGSMLLERSALETAAERLTPDDFYRDAHQHIFKAMIALAGRNEPVDLISLPDELKCRNVFESAGGLLYLQILMDAPSSAANIAYYAGLVLGYSQRRRLLAASGEIHRMAQYGEMAPEEMAEKAESLVFGICGSTAKRVSETLGCILNDELDKIELRSEQNSALSGIACGFSDLDYMLSGLQPSDLLILGARPSMGKTSLGLQIAANVAKAGKPAVVFSLEMARGQLARRLLAIESGVDSASIRNALLTEADWSRLSEGAMRLSHIPLTIDDQASVTTRQIRAECRRLVAEKRQTLGLVMVDYLQMMRTVEKKEREDQEIGDIAQGLKAIAKEFGCPVLALSQLSRQVESRPNKRPNLSDLRGSGEIEAHADVVLFLYRDAYYQSEKSSQSEEAVEGEIEEAEVIIAKQRNGSTGTVTLGFLPRMAKFVDIYRRGY